jgi:hypothetical protein
MKDRENLKGKEEEEDVFRRKSKRSTEKMCFNESGRGNHRNNIKKSCQCTFWQVIKISQEWIRGKKA